MAHLALKAGREAGEQFGDILNHRGENADSLLYPLAHLGLARAAALVGDVAQARRSYETFFGLWQDADADLGVVQDARREYARLR
jgi:hypothetical protein